jgi:hypothetical protein
VCGIVGYIYAGKPDGNKKHARLRRLFIEKGLILDTVRGDDATGAFTVDITPNPGFNQGRPAWWKSTEAGPEFVKAANFRQHFRTLDLVNQYKFVVGHNRSATWGGTTVKAAHPFQEKNITMVHNGTLESTFNLKMSQHEAKAENDSHTICHNLTMEPAETVIQKLNGAFTLVWHDTKDDSLNFVRNSKRPLHFSRSTLEDTVFFASEAEELYLLDKQLKLGLGTISSLKVAHWLKFKSGTLVPEIKEVKLYTAPPKAQSTQYTYPEDKWTKNYGSNTSSPTKMDGNGSSKGITIRDAMFSRDLNDPMTTLLPSNKPVTSYHQAKTILHAAERNGEIFPKVSVGRTIRTVPEMCLLNLLEQYRILPQDDLRIIPLVGTKTGIISSTGSETYTVSGTVFDKKHPVMPVIVYGVPAVYVKHYADKLWTVRPITIRYHDLVNKQPFIVCQYLSVNVPSAPFKPDNEQPADDEPTPDDAGLVPGPNGVYISEEEWDQATKNGCIECGGEVKLEDADTIEWVNDRRDPLCQECTDKATDPESGPEREWVDILESISPKNKGKLN